MNAIVDKKDIVFVKTFAKGRDGATWYSGNPEDIKTCKTGDFCFNPLTYDIFKCVNGGTAGGEWEFVCCLDVTGDIKRLMDEIKNSPGYKPWWFGTRAEYNSLSGDEKNSFVLHFIEEGS